MDSITEYPIKKNIFAIQYELTVNSGEDISDPKGSAEELKVNTKLGNICIPKNSEIWIPVSAVHRDPDYYSNAEVFKPERFLVKSRSKVIEGSYVAFGGDGARGCIAQSVALLEIKLCLISLLKNYRFAKCGLTKELQYESSNEMFASMTPTNVFVKIIKRSKGILE
ncbi:unnamed protein product [Oppiella nova]|uniref:Cytochrome P450 n=1 Tax=Oppiella nova TaxID=334625 RepID=A0A7R9LTS3_9ACAR|nr:unnamed protein product [Oppiella nova]CAG2166869.1 unnamed protein product [Oppiella nova]